MSEFSEGMVEEVRVFNRPLTSGEVCVLYSQDPMEWRWKIYHDGGEGYQATSIVHGPAVPDWEIAVVPAILLEEAQAALAAAPDYRHEAERLADAAESLMERMDNFEMSRPAGAWLELVTALATYRAALHVGEVQ